MVGRTVLVLPYLYYLGTLFISRLKFLPISGYACHGRNAKPGPGRGLNKYLYVVAFSKGK